MKKYQFNKKQQAKLPLEKLHVYLPKEVLSTATKCSQEGQIESVDIGILLGDGGACQDGDSGYFVHFPSFCHLLFGPFPYPFPSWNSYKEARAAILAYKQLQAALANSDLEQQAKRQLEVQSSNLQAHIINCHLLEIYRESRELYREGGRALSGIDQVA